MWRVHAALLCAIMVSASDSSCMIDVEVCDLGPGGGVGAVTCHDLWTSTLDASCAHDSDCEIQFHPMVSGGLTCHEGRCVLSCHPGAGVTNMFDILNFDCHGRGEVPNRHVCAAHSACSASKMQQYNDICCGNRTFAPGGVASEYLTFACDHPISANLYP